MSRRERDKGVRGEREVLELLERHGFEVRGLEEAGDHLAFGHGVTLHVETKRQETARPWAWYEQATNEAPAGTIPIVAFRRSRSRWLGLVDLEALATMLLVAHRTPNGDE
jgi:Holliday junction resolvase